MKTRLAMDTVLFYMGLLSTLVVTMAEAQQQQQRPHTQPIKVFVLAGQSNMNGYGNIHPHLDSLIHNSTTMPCCNPYRRALWNETSQTYNVRNDVYITYAERSGPLTVGYGGNENVFGPELMIGWELGDTYDEPIYLIKTSWGGMDLAVDFRPPRSGEGMYANVLPSHYGWRYRSMVEGVQEGLEQIASIIPNYNETIGYQVSGLVWFQGWNDMLDSTKVEEYAYNLANFLRDTSNEWQVPDLPVVIGELGMHGTNISGYAWTDRVMGLRQAQRKVPSMPEFRNRSVFVPTAQYAVLDGTAYTGIYHYNGRADSYFHIGKALGKGMLYLLKGQQAKTTMTKNHFLRGSLEEAIARNVKAS